MPCHHKAYCLNALLSLLVAPFPTLHLLPLCLSALPFLQVALELQVLIGNHVPFDLPVALAQAAPLQPIPINEQQIQQVVDFVLRRLEQVLVDGGTSIEAVRAVLRQRGSSPALAAESAQQLQVCLSNRQPSVNGVLTFTTCVPHLPHVQRYPMPCHDSP